jgi:DNA polymerase-4
MARTILHVDLDSFFCSVEELLQPSLAGRAFVVAGRAEDRGVVSSASYPARRYGIRSAMPTAQAIRLLPDLLVVPPRHDTYGAYSRRVMDLLRQAAPRVEPVSVDEAFLDVSDDGRGGESVAFSLQEEIRRRVRLPSSWGVASNKLVAKIATNVGKPNGLIVVPGGEESSFLAPLPVKMIWGVGPRTQARLLELGVRTASDLAAVPASTLTAIFGAHGIDLASRALGQDDSPVLDSQDPQSISTERTFVRDVGAREVLHGEIRRMAEELGSRVREDGWAGWTVRLKVRWPNFRTQTRQVRLDQPTDRDREIYDAARRLLEAIWVPPTALRLIGVGLSDLGAPIRQLELFDRTWEEDQNLLRAVDEIRLRYGPQAVRRASELPRSRKPFPGNRRGGSAPIDPEKPAD